MSSPSSRPSNSSMCRSKWMPISQNRRSCPWPPSWCPPYFYLLRRDRWGRLPSTSVGGGPCYRSLRWTAFFGGNGSSPPSILAGLADFWSLVWSRGPSERLECYLLTPPGHVLLYSCIGFLCLWPLLGTWLVRSCRWFPGRRRRHICPFLGVWGWRCCWSWFSFLWCRVGKSNIPWYCLKLVS